MAAEITPALLSACASLFPELEPEESCPEQSDCREKGLSGLVLSRGGPGCLREARGTALKKA